MGLVRYYWVALKLGITIVATVSLLIYMGTVRQMAGVAADPNVDVALVRNASPMVHAILALLLLLVATVFGVYKPFGLTSFGRRRLVEHRQDFLPMALSAVALELRKRVHRGGSICWPS